MMSERISKVLIVDDTETMRRLYGRVLESKGFSVTLASGGEDALEVLEDEVPDLILLDYMMPGIGGLDLLKIVRGRPELEDIPVVFLTALGEEDEVVAQAFKLGISDYMTKPVNHHVLAARLESLISAHRARTVEVRLAAGSLADHDELLREVEGAKKLQQSQLPDLSLAWSGWRVSAFLEPCTQLGGDLYDVIDIGDARVAALIDVSGHGVAAAMVASAVRATLRLLVRTVPFHQVMPALNRQLIEGGDFHYACIALVQISASEVSIVNAGLPPVAIISGGRVVAEVVASGTPPGLVDDAEYDYETISTKPGDRIVLASDGFTEPFGHASCTAPFIEGLRLLYPSQTLEDLSADLHQRTVQLFAQRSLIPDDDVTVVVLDQLTVS